MRVRPQEREHFRIGVQRYGVLLVYIDDTIMQMRRRIARDFGGRAEGLSACCLHLHSRTDPDVRGALFFARTCLGAGVVAHEAAHAAFRMCEDAAIKVRHWRHVDGADGLSTNSDEETFCTILEQLNVAFWREAYRRGYAEEAQAGAGADGHRERQAPDGGRAVPAGVRAGGGEVDVAHPAAGHPASPGDPEAAFALDR